MLTGKERGDAGMKDTPEKKKDAEEQEELSERTVFTAIDQVDTAEAQKAYIIFISGQLAGKLCYLEKPETVIGRAVECDISIADQRISRLHLKISVKAGKAVIEDLGSTNGTFVNGSRILLPQQLQNGDQVHISSDTLFKFALGKEAELILLKEMHQMANYDAVTGIYNKHVLEKRLNEEFSYAHRKKIPLSLLMLDIDHFKKVNDTHGHMAGDYVLQGIAKRIGKALRGEDILARYGGEEFVVIMRGTGTDGAVRMAERIRLLVASEPFRFEKIAIPCTISIGVATAEKGNLPDVAALIAHADSCLYRSKEGGRNRVTA
jgi:two-component system cell cycle response regulator